MSTLSTATCRCGYSATIKEHALGRWGRCPQCQQRLFLGPVSASTAATLPSKPNDRPGPFQDPASRKQLLAIIGVAVLVLGYRYGDRLYSRPAVVSTAQLSSSRAGGAIPVAGTSDESLTVATPKSPLALGAAPNDDGLSAATLLPAPAPVTPTMPHQAGDLLPLNYPGAIAVRGVAFVPHVPQAFVVFQTPSDSFLVKFDLTTGKALGPGVPLTRDGVGEVHLLLSPDGRFLVGAQSRIEQGLGLLDAQSGQVLKSQSTRRASLAPPIWSRNEQGVYWGNHEGDLATWACRGDIAELTGSQGKLVTRLALSADGRFLCSGDADGEIRIWDTQDHGRYAASYRRHAGPIQCLETKRYADGVLVLSVSGRLGQTMQVDLWDLQTQARRFTTSVPGPILKVAASPDWQVLVAGHKTGELSTFDLTTEQDLEQVQPHRGEVSQVAVSSDGLFSLSGCQRSPENQTDATVWLRGLRRRLMAAPSMTAEVAP
jgi:hypothetical protein